LALHVHLLQSLRNTDIFEEIRFFNNLNCLLEIDYTLLKHTQLLETHSHVEIRNISKVLVSLAVLKIDNFQD